MSKRLVVALCLLGSGACGDDGPTADGGGGVGGGGAGGDGDGGSAPATACEEAWFERCRRACECQPGPACTFAPGVTADPDGGMSIHLGASIADEDDCRSVATIECIDGGGENPDWPACLAENETAACETFEDQGNEYTGVVPIHACDFH